MTNSFDQRTGCTPSRRTVLRAAAWTAPAVSIAVAAPAYACSNPPTDVPGTVNWVTDYDYVTKRANSSLSDGTPILVEVVNRFGGAMAAYNGIIATPRGVSYRYRNLDVSPHNVGGLSHRGLTLAQDPGAGFGAPRNSHFQAVTFRFAQTVKDLKFTITDIDRLSNNHSDRLFLDAPAPDSLRRGDVVGVGTSETPWRNSAAGNLDPIESNRGNVDVVFSQPVLTFTLNFWNDNSSGGVQQIFISNMTFAVARCT